MNWSPRSWGPAAQISHVIPLLNMENSLVHILSTSYIGCLDGLYQLLRCSTVIVSLPPIPDLLEGQPGFTEMSTSGTLMYIHVGGTGPATWEAMATDHSGQRKTTAAGIQRGEHQKSRQWEERREYRQQCVVPENIHTHLEEGYWKFQLGGGSQKPKFLKESKRVKGVCVWGGGGVENKKPCSQWEGYGYFLEHHKC